MRTTGHELPKRDDDERGRDKGTKRGGTPERGRSVPVRKQEKLGSCHDRQRAAIYSGERGYGEEAKSDGPRESPLSRHAARWQGIRQFIQAQRASDVSAESR